jgi:hypothetical protein
MNRERCRAQSPAAAEFSLALDDYSRTKHLMHNQGR